MQSYVQAFVEGVSRIGAHLVVLGPPAAGKSTLCSLLATREDRAIFRLRELVPPNKLAGSVSTSSALRWLDDQIVRDALSNFLTYHAKVRTSILIYDNFPGSADQVSMLAALSRAIPPPRRYLALVLSLDSRLTRLRANARRVCQTCEKDPIADPRLPASTLPQQPSTCRVCGSELATRLGDKGDLFLARLSRYNSNEPSVRQALLAHGFEVNEASAQWRPSRLESLAEDLVRELPEPTAMEGL